MQHVYEPCQIASKRVIWSTPPPPPPPPPPHTHTHTHTYTHVHKIEKKPNNFSPLFSDTQWFSQKTETTCTREWSNCGIRICAISGNRSCVGLTYIYVQHEVNFLRYHVVYFALLYYYMINVGAEIIAKLFRNYGALYITPADYRNILLLSLET